MPNSQENKLALLIITFMVPYPANDGGKIYCFGYVDWLRSFMNITLVLKITSAADLRNANELKKIWPDVNIHIVDLIDIPASRSILDKFRAGFRRLSVLGEKKKQTPLQMFMSSGFLNANWHINDPRMVSSLKQLLKQSTFDIIQTEHTSNLSLVAIFPSSSKKIFVEIESLFLIGRDKLNATGCSADSFESYMVDHTRMMEYAFMKHYNAVFALNQKDYQRIGEELKSAPAKVYLSPYGVLEPSVLSDEFITSYRSDKLVFLGSELHAPNADAVRWFAKDILPELLKKHPTLQLHVTGSWSEAFKNAYKSTPGIVFAGFVNDLNAYIQNSIMVVPIRLGGGGMRAKVLDGLKSGCPVVSTSLGCEGFEATGDAIKTADDAASFIAAVDSLWTNPQECRQMIKKGNEAILNYFNFERLGKERLEYYQKVTAQ